MDWLLSAYKRVCLHHTWASSPHTGHSPQKEPAQANRQGFHSPPSRLNTGAGNGAFIVLKITKEASGLRKWYFICFLCSNVKKTNKQKENKNKNHQIGCHFSALGAMQSNLVLLVYKWVATLAFPKNSAVWRKTPLQSSWRHLTCAWHAWQDSIHKLSWVETVRRKESGAKFITTHPYRYPHIEVYHHNWHKPGCPGSNSPLGNAV